MSRIIGCLFILVATPVCQGAVILDQEYMIPAHSGVNYYHDYPEDYLAQTFTVQNSGELAGIGVQAAVSGRGPFTDDLHVRITRVGQDGFALADEVLAATTISPTELPVSPSTSPERMTDVDLSGSHVTVSAGDRLAILLSSIHSYFSPPHRYYDPNTPHHYLWFFQILNPHPGGEFSIYSPKAVGPTPLRDIYLPVDDKTVDAGFRVYVNKVPEPTSISAFVILGGFLVALRHQQRRGDLWCLNG
ncbi:MAG: PEP-CTERM sorting domain-containing protein [Planctomycetales bacterium]|nr:PEP-CTERM sorting domain-containing protein [Planctomycetales bacterium]